MKSSIKALRSPGTAKSSIDIKSLNFDPSSLFATPLKSSKKAAKRTEITSLAALLEKKKKSLERKRVAKKTGVIDPSLFFFGEDDPIVLEGDIYRFKPGLEHNFISRWIQVSKRAFRYFKNQIASLGEPGFTRAIVSIPKGAIEDICKIDIHKEGFMTRKHMPESERNLFNYMFEIYLREDYEDLYKYRDQELNAARSRSGSRSSSRRSRCQSVASEGGRGQSPYSTTWSKGGLRGAERRELSTYERMVQLIKKEQYYANIISPSTNVGYEGTPKTTRIVQVRLYMFIITGAFDGD